VHDSEGVFVDELERRVVVVEEVESRSLCADEELGVGAVESEGGEGVEVSVEDEDLLDSLAEDVARAESEHASDEVVGGEDGEGVEVESGPAGESAESDI